MDKALRLVLSVVLQCMLVNAPVVCFGQSTHFIPQIFGTQPTSGGTVNWTLANFTYFGTCGNVTSCSPTGVPNFTAGNAVVLGAMTGATTANPITGVTGGGGTWVHCPSCSVAHSGSGSVDFYYNLSVAGGAPSLNVTIGSSFPFFAVQVWEVNRGTGTATYDTSNTATPATCTSCATPALTLTGSKDAIFELAAPANSITAISTYTFNSNADSVGVAYGLNITTGTAVNWTQSPTGIPAEAAIALK